MDSEIAISVDHVSKKFCRSFRASMLYGLKDVSRNLLGMGTGSDRLRKDEFWAVNDVSFQLRRGETLGLIGPNGSGKSTILKMLSGIYLPDKGEIRINGRVGALIEIGAGFHPMLSGRENIYINGAILGMSKKEIDRKFDDIVAFADIGDFLDMPVKNYSSGMYVRLGFAVAVHCEPDVLLVDEVLAVGDRDFQIKCFRKLHELTRENGITLVLISHNEYAIREYTGQCLVLNTGKNVYWGPTETGISFYLNGLLRQRTLTRPETINYLGNGIIKGVTFKNGKGERAEKIVSGQKLVIDFEYSSEQTIKSPIFGISFYNDSGLFTGLWNSYEGISLPDIKGRGIVRVIVDPLDLPVDSYHCAVVVCEQDEANVLEWKDLEQKILVERADHTRGYLKLRQTWEVTQ
ncbi:MAG: ABC transporter ATP-binding protein [Chloroflexi bacterium]|nr:ABC transporter ATP-binding protein [Chloroflexota bacterium]